MTSAFRLPRMSEPVRDPSNLRTVVVRSVEAGGSCDALTAIARAHSMRLVCAALGVPRQDWGLFSCWSDRSAEPRSLDLLGAYVDVMIADRCRKPTDDLVADLIAVDVDGTELTADRLRAIVVSLVTA